MGGICDLPRKTNGRRIKTPAISKDNTLVRKAKPPRHVRDPSQQAPGNQNISQMQIASKEKPTRKRRQRTHHPTSQNRVRPKALDNRSTKARSVVPNKAPKKQEPDTCRYMRDEESTPEGPETARNQGSSNMGSQGRNPPRRKQWSRHDGKRTTCPQAACSSKANTRRLKREAKLTRHGKVSQTSRQRRPKKP